MTTGTAGIDFDCAADYQNCTELNICFVRNVILHPYLIWFGDLTDQSKSRACSDALFQTIQKQYTHYINTHERFPKKSGCSRNYLSGFKFDVVVRRTKMVQDLSLLAIQ
ncbi:hypothetical protein POM88_033386 [Heracleum sosnowskyi]|uniref:Uncharacterized protein n=1 Tax=Heracleum sosnowskyi TaxID=360622 RepID=A0AAD8MM70_9APIA|nr:hypothetical protein POM88_033386 [Heracleum sosnowskyi]